MPREAYMLEKTRREEKSRLYALFRVQLLVSIDKEDTKKQVSIRVRKSVTDPSSVMNRRRIMGLRQRCVARSTPATAQRQASLRRDRRSSSAN